MLPNWLSRMGRQRPGVKSAARCTGLLWTSAGPAILGAMSMASLRRDSLFLLLLALLLLVGLACKRQEVGEPLVEEAPAASVSTAGEASSPGVPSDAVMEATAAREAAADTAAKSLARCAGVEQHRGTDVVLKEVARGFDRPVDVVAVSGEKNLFVILEQAGLARIGSPGEDWREFLDLRDVVASEGEQGLLSLAFHPSYESNGRLFVYYTVGAGDVRLSEFKVAGEGALAAVERASERSLLKIDQRFSNHFAGQLLFGSDGLLYVGIGDGGSEGDPDNNAQRLDSLLGKMLRIDVDRVGSDQPYGIPSDNPFVGKDDAKGEIWALGLRNPWRFSFDRGTGRLWISDVGSLAWEELSIGIKGGNYGWKILEGSHCFEEGCDLAHPGLVAPIWEYGRTRGISVIGGFVYRGCALPDLQGLYLFSDYRPPDSPLWSLSFSGQGAASRGAIALESTGAVISSFSEDAAGEIYAVDHLGGRLLKLVGRPR